MPIEAASAKAKPEGVVEQSEGNYAIPIWAGVIPVRQVMRGAEPDSRLLLEAALPANLAGYEDGRDLANALADARIRGAKAQVTS